MDLWWPANVPVEAPLSATPGGLDSDPELEKVHRYLGTAQRLDRIRRAVRRALDEVIATSRTRRWNLDQCNNQEKAYVGVNLENILREVLELPAHKARRPDFEIDGVEVDCKWSRSYNGWMIPREAVGHLCLLVYGDDLDDQLAVGLVRIREDILVKGNQDKKRSLQSPGGLSEVRWLLPPGRHLPSNFLMNLRKADRDAILSQPSGDARLQMLFRRCEGLIISRGIIEAIGQQKDAARRARGTTIESLLEEGLEVLNGWQNDKKRRALELGGPPIDASTWICLRSDGSSPERLAAAEPIRLAEAALYRKELKKELAAQRRHAKSLQDEEARLVQAMEAEAERTDLASLEAVESAAVVAAQVATQLELRA